MGKKKERKISKEPLIKRICDSVYLGDIAEKHRLFVSVKDNLHCKSFASSLSKCQNVTARRISTPVQHQWKEVSREFTRVHMSSHIRSYTVKVAWCFWYTCSFLNDAFNPECEKKCKHFILCGCTLFCNSFYSPISYRPPVCVFVSRSFIHMSFSILYCC